MSETYMRVHVETYMHVQLSLNFQWKLNKFGPIETKLIHFHRISKNGGGGGGGHGGGSPLLIETYIYMYANTHTIWLHPTCITGITWTCNSYVLQRYMGRVVLWIWAELSYKLGPSWHGHSFMWAELARAELVLGRVFRNSSGGGGGGYWLPVFHYWPPVNLEPAINVDMVN